ncbi:ameloblastin isoform X1 [Corvus moneduloides]|uniref:ameloblastin isoform X1 n=1 Tax=Corvus moneduloides TaxID=1196302 RepID=UPI0013638A65|nr:ameloblastin isoform X1 [Corvus moneduloides]
MGIGKEGDPEQGCLSQIPGDPSLPPALFGVELGAGNAPWGLREGVGNSPWNSQGVGGAWHSRESSAGRWNSLVGNSSCRGRGPGTQGCFSGNLLLSLCNKNGFGSFGWRENPGFILCSSPVFLPCGMCRHSRRAWDGSGLCCHSQSGFHGSNPCVGIPSMAFLWIQPLLAFPGWILWIQPLFCHSRVDFHGSIPLWHSQGGFYGSIPPLALPGWILWIHFSPLAFPGWFSWIHPPLAFPGWILWIHFSPLAFLGWVLWIHFSPLAFPGWILWIHFSPLAFPGWFLWIHFSPLAFLGWIFMDPSPSGIPSSPIPTQLLGQALPHFSKAQSHFPCPGHPSGT